MLQKFKITSYAFIVVFIMVHVFIIPAFGIEEPDGSSPPPKWDGKVPPKPHIDKSTMPKKEGDRKMAVEPAKEGAVQNDIPGIDADCGGSMACATCHVYVEEKWFTKLQEKTEGEDDMLDIAFKPNKFSRLSCQIVVSDELDGLRVKMPEQQG